MNQRCWERFERQVAGWYAEKLDEVWVVTGPIFLDPCIELTTDVRVPQAFFKIVVARIAGEVEMLGIVMPNERTEKSRISNYVHTVDEIEQLTGLDLFHELDDEVEKRVEADDEQHERWYINWELRPVFSGTDRGIEVRECD